MRPKRFRSVITGILMVLLLFGLTGCSKKTSPGEKAYQYLEQAATVEASFKKQQQPLLQEEQKEQKLFNEIMALDIKTKYNEIKTKSDEALKGIVTRRQLMKKEKDSIDQAETVFKKAIPLLQEVKRTQSAPLAKALIKDMNDRYASFGQLYPYYDQSLNDEKTLFTMLQTKGLTVEKLQAQLDKVNASYKKINQEKQKFNDLTNQFNKDKQAFYKSMNIMGNHSG